MFDPECELCRWAQGLLRRWDTDGRIGFVSVHDPVCSEWFPDRDPDDRAGAVLFIDADGRVWEGFDAARKVISRLKLGWTAACLLSLPGASWLARRGFEWAARNRYRFQGSRSGRRA